MLIEVKRFEKNILLLGIFLNFDEATSPLDTKKLWMHPHIDVFLLIPLEELLGRGKS